MHDTAEYLPQDSEQSELSKGSLASHQAWETAKARAIAATRKTPYDLRRQVCLCNDAKLTNFSKLLFCRLTDMAFESEFKRGDGIVACSKKFLADDFDCVEGTVTRATRRLEVAGFLWTKTIWNGSFEITWWFIREWADDSKEYGRHTGANFGGRVQGVRRNTLRGHKGKFAANPNSERSQFRAWKSAQTAVKAKLHGANGQESTLTTGMNAPGQGASLHPVNGQESTLTTCTDARGQGASIDADHVHESTLTTGMNAPGHGAEVTGLDTLKTINGDSEGDSSKRSTGLNAQGAGREPRKASAANLFLLEVGIVMDRWKKGHGKTELSGSGVWWRFAFAQDAKLLRRVLEDTLSAVKESRIKTTPGAHAVDLWKRWGGKPVGKEAR